MAIELTLKSAEAHSGVPLRHYWNECVGAGRANEGLRADWQEQLRSVVAECGFRYVRFHGLFHDDMFVYREEAHGAPVYNFQYVDALFDRLLEIGIKPFVELGFCPSDLARERGTVFWWKGNGSPPKDFAKWADLVRRTVAHWIGRYGITEVRSWYFEVWNEPNLRPFFRGTKSEYFALYKASVEAIKSIDSHLRVGGPATSNFVPDARFEGETEDAACHAVVLEAKDLDALEWKPVWVEEFLAWCHANGLPVDFVSCHPYPTDWALDEHGQGKKLTRAADATTRDLITLRSLIDASPYPMAEIHLTEWSSSSSPRDFTHDYLQAATFIVKANVESAGLVDSLAYWTFTDIFEEGGAGDTIFHGGFGLINGQGIVKPAFHAYRFLNALGDVLLSSSRTGNGGGIVTRQGQSGKLCGLAYHYPEEMPQAVPASFGGREVAERTLNLGLPETLRIDWSGLPPHAPMRIERLDRGRGDAMTAWQAMGEPETPDCGQTEALRVAARATETIDGAADAEGRFTWAGDMSPWSVVLIQEQ